MHTGFNDFERDKIVFGKTRGEEADMPEEICNDSALTPDKIATFRAQKFVIIKLSKKTLNVLAAANMIGSEKGKLIYLLNTKI